MGKEDFFFCHWYAESEDDIFDNLEKAGFNSLMMTLPNEMPRNIFNMLKKVWICGKQLNISYLSEKLKTKNKKRKKPSSKKKKHTKSKRKRSRKRT